MLLLTQLPSATWEKWERPVFSSLQHKPTLLCCKKPWCQCTAPEPARDHGANVHPQSCLFIWLGKTKGQELPAVTGQPKTCLQALWSSWYEQHRQPLSMAAPLCCSIRQMRLDSPTSRFPSKLETKLFPSGLRRPKDEEGPKLAKIS